MSIKCTEYTKTNLFSGLFGDLFSWSPNFSEYLNSIAEYFNSIARAVLIIKYGQYG